MCRVDSYIRVGKSGFDSFTVETSGMEEEIKNWKEGDIVRVEGKISFFRLDGVFLMNFYPEGNNIKISLEN